MKYFLFALFTYCLFTCKNADHDNKEEYDLSSAKDAFDYPNLTNKTDTDIFVYQLKDSLKQEDSFLYVNYGTNYLKKFNEPNLSLKSLPIETFRFSYCPFGYKAINITFDRNEMLVKIGASGYLDQELNYNKLDSLETIRFKFLERYFFRSRQSLSDRKRKYYDSMIKKNPELKSIQYYKKLIDKCTDYDSANFKYSTRIIKLSEHDYNNIMDSLKRTNFDKLSWKFDPKILITDGGGYTFEANTENKYKYFVCLTMPVDSLPITKFCRYLLKMAKVDTETKL